jgi:hypothetical protein
VDGITVEDGHPVLDGWTCADGSNNSLAVHVYAGGPAGQGGQLVLGGWADRVSEPIIGQICGASGMLHRFRIDLSSIAHERRGQRLWAYGIWTCHGKVGALENGGAFAVP